MPDIQYIGNKDPAALQIQAGYPKKKRTGDGWEVTYLYKTWGSSAENVIPAPDSACPLDLYKDLLLKEVDVSPDSVPGYVMVEMIYRAHSTQQSSHKDQEVVQNAQQSWREIPVDASDKSDSEIEEDRDDGFNTVGVATVRYTYTKYEKTFVWSEANILAGVGQKGVAGTPTGITDVAVTVPPSKNWLNMGSNIRDDGGLTEVSTTWEYDHTGWKGIATVAAP